MLPEARGLEFLIIAAIALIVVGPKELPNLLRKLGQFVGKMRRIAADFRTSFDEMAKQSELDDLRKQVEEMRSQASAATADPMGLNKTMSEFNTGMDAQFNHGVIPEEYQAPPEPSHPHEPAEPELPFALEPEPIKPVKTRAAKPKADLGVDPASAAPAPRKRKAALAEGVVEPVKPARKRAAPKISS
ncbi:MAG: twin-arginine translocase subunit TatB [Zymomonas sp.]|nr:MAG: twin-arginine translocase subunit TatB [Zymomonas sp.]